MTKNLVSASVTSSTLEKKSKTSVIMLKAGTLVLRGGGVEVNVVLVMKVRIGFLIFRPSESNLIEKSPNWFVELMQPILIYSHRLLEIVEGSLPKSKLWILLDLR